MTEAELGEAKELFEQSVQIAGGIGKMSGTEAPKEVQENRAGFGAICAVSGADASRKRRPLERLAFGDRFCTATASGQQIYPGVIDSSIRPGQN